MYGKHSTFASERDICGWTKNDYMLFPLYFILCLLYLFLKQIQCHNTTSVSPYVFSHRTQWLRYAPPASILRLSILSTQRVYALRMIIRVTATISLNSANRLILVTEALWDRNTVFRKEIMHNLSLANWSFKVNYHLNSVRYKPKVVGSIPDGVIGIFHWYNPSGSNMALG